MGASKNKQKLESLQEMMEEDSYQIIEFCQKVKHRLRKKTNLNRNIKIIKQNSNQEDWDIIKIRFDRLGHFSKSLEDYMDQIKLAYYRYNTCESKGKKSFWVFIFIYIELKYFTQFRNEKRNEKSV